MIVFDLACHEGHVFEVWFGSTEDFESQRDRGLVSCPLCGSAKVDKAVMAPRVARKGNQAAPSPASLPVASGGPPAERMKAMMEALAAAQKEALKNSDWVGSRFADEARAMHVGEVENRSIHGKATADEARSLIEDGIAVAPLPFPVRPPEQDN